MVRTCSVRFAAMMFTQSVRSFHVPATPGTLACPPNRPSVPTSLATLSQRYQHRHSAMQRQSVWRGDMTQRTTTHLVTSDENDRKDSTMLLTVLLSSRISPNASTLIFLLRSPSATAVVLHESAQSARFARYLSYISPTQRRSTRVPDHCTRSGNVQGRNEALTLPPSFSPEW